MMTSRNNTRLMEQYLSGMLSPVERLLLEAKLAINPALKRELYAQQKAHFLVKLYHREKLKEELEALHQRIFNDPDQLSFQQRMYHIFK